MNAGELRNKIELWKNGTGRNELGEDDDAPELYCCVNAKIIPNTGAVQSLRGDATETSISHKIMIRARNDLTKEMFIRYKGQRYDIAYWQPVYNNTRYMEILTKMEV